MYNYSYEENFTDLPEAKIQFLFLKASDVISMLLTFLILR